MSDRHLATSILVGKKSKMKKKMKENLKAKYRLNDMNLSLINDAVELTEK